MGHFIKRCRQLAFLGLALGLAVLPTLDWQSRTWLLPVARGAAISTFTVTASTSPYNPSTSADLTLAFTPATAITSGASLSIGFQAPPDARFGLANVQGNGLGNSTSSNFVGGGSGIGYVDTQFGFININALNIPASSQTIVLQGVTAPSKAGIYTVELRTYQNGLQIDIGTASVQVGTIALQGTVSKPASLGGGGVMGVWVEAQEKGNFTKRFGSPTANDGSYGIGGLESGKTYIVSTFVNPMPGSDTANVAGADSVEVTYAGSALTQNFTLKSPSKTVTGELSRANGAKVANGQIMAMRTDGPGFMSATTNSSGAYTLKLTGGKWEIRPNTFGGPGQSQTDYSFSGQGTQVAFAKNDIAESKSGVNFTVVTASSTIKGKVSPIPGGFAGIGIFNRGGFGTGTQITPGTGAFEAKVPPGTYELGMFMDPSQAGTRYALPPREPVNVADGATIDLGTLSLVEMNKTISAVVKDKETGNGVASFDVFCFQPSGGGFSMGRTNDNGSATIKVTNGKWGCMAMAGFGGEGSTKHSFLKRLHLVSTVLAQSVASSTKYVVAGGPQFVTVADNTPSLKFEALKANRKITVSVIRADNNTAVSEQGFIEAKLVGSSLGDNFDKGGSLGAPIDPNQPGMGTLTVPAGVYELRMMTPPGSDYSAGDTTKVDVTVGDASANVFVLPNDAIVAGRIKDENGDTVKNVPIMVTATSKKGAFIVADVNMTDGTFSMKVPSAGGELNLGYHIDPSSGFFSQALTNNTIKPIADKTVGLDITVRRANATATITVIDPNNNPVSNATVEADNRKLEKGQAQPFEGFFNHDSETDANGKVTLKFPAGDYTFRAYITPEALAANKWMLPRGHKTSLKKDETANLVMQLQRAEVEAKVTVTKSDGSAASGATVFGFSENEESIEAITNASGQVVINVTKGKWHFMAKADESSGSATTLQTSDEQVVDTTSGKAVELSIALKSLGTAATTVTQTSDSDNAISAELVGSGLMSGAAVSAPANAFDTDSNGSNVTVTLTPTAVATEKLEDRPLDGAAVDISAQNSQGTPISNFTTSVEVTIPIKESDLKAAGFTKDSVATGEVGISYLSSDTGDWTRAEGGQSVSDNGDGTLSIKTSTTHFTVFAVTGAKDTVSPDAPTGVTATDATTGGAVKLAWTNPANSDFASIKIYRSTKEGQLGSAVHSAVSGTTKEDTGLTDGTKYYYTVRAVDTSGNESTNTTQLAATPSKAAAASSPAPTLPKTGRPGPGGPPALPPFLWLVGLLGYGYGLTRRPTA